jgi:hypothetical protein
VDREFAELMETCKGSILPESLRNPVLDGSGLQRISGYQHAILFGKVKIVLYNMSHQDIVMCQETFALGINLFREMMIKIKMI